MNVAGVLSSSGGLTIASTASISGARGKSATPTNGQFEVEIVCLHVWRKMGGEKDESPDKRTGQARWKWKSSGSVEAGIYENMECTLHNMNIILQL